MRLSRSLLARRIFGDKDELPIQAADLIAWGVRRANDTKAHQFRWLARMFRGLLVSKESPSFDADWFAAASASRPSWEDSPRS